MKQNWTQFTYRVRIDELGPYPKRLNFKGGKKGPKVLGSPLGAGFGPFGSVSYTHLTLPTKRIV